ncbi:HEL111Cp [Eremothecium sinecaudum]|uniref:guanosine-diphosphatase n=1 Tax=Eremothecium sinecaudum TaxID=45286 RepID=A0A0X8HTI1_9SACH|nr:HEL111Cp [Eremothecium sinecaudum]AMD21169.1 HEL111Cp [Eremothecium sinecaudum]
MAISTHGFIRNYRFVIGALTVLMLILMLKLSASPIPFKDPKATSYGSDTYKILPISNKPGYVEDKLSQAGNPDVANAVMEDLANSSSQSNKNAKCDKDHKYIIMIDAGSTGSRIHVYEFDVCTQPPTLVEEKFKMLEPGLSSFDTDAAGAAASLDPLLKVAVDFIPASKRYCSPVAVKATAGLRLLGEEKSTKILNAVRTHLEKDFDFPVVERDGISIMGGDEEGVYAWITTNYLLGNVGTDEKSHTAAIFDLGGGSTQIVFEPNYPVDEPLLEGDHKYQLDFGSHKYTLYQYSHLGYGQMEARNKINSQVVENAIKNKVIKDNLDTVHEIVSPCLAPGTRIEKAKVTVNAKTYTVNFKAPPEPAYSQCRALADKILKKDSDCKLLPCSFNGIHQPSLVHSFHSTSDLYVFSYFYDRTAPLGLPSSFSLQEFKDVNRMVCMGKESWPSYFGGIEGALESLSKQPNWCLDLTYQLSLLQNGYDIPLHRELKTAATIKGKELGWCLGASLAVLQADNLECKVMKESKV